MSKGPKVVKRIKAKTQVIHRAECKDGVDLVYMLHNMAHGMQL